ncbi:MAG TPA: hypothetical protein VIT65_06875 [Microlunatus sp.]
MRIVALCLSLTLLVLAACTWSGTEPGLLQQRGASTGTSSPAAPAPTNPKLPVAGETTWTTAEGQQVTSRIAVHAVRRGQGLTVLDWSVTPLSAPDRQTGDEVPPGFDLGLDRTSTGGINIVLIDPRKKKVYRPLSHHSREQTYRCLCTPIWSAQATLHIGETRLLQVAYPALPTSVRFVDVVAATLPPFGHLPVSPEAFAPTATHPADLTRPPEPTEPLTAPQYFQTDDGAATRRTATLRVDEVLAGADSTTVRWTLRSMSGQRAFLVVPLGPPLVAVAPPEDPILSTNAASGPTLNPANGRAMAARWMTGGFEDRPFLECLCTNLDFWAIGLRSAGGSAQLVTTYPALPRGVNRVDIVLPGTANLTGLVVTPAPDGSIRVGPPARTPTELWTYDEKRPPAGWATDRWPTPLPDPAQLADYDRVVNRLTTLGD